MTGYYINQNRQPSGDFEVHVNGCTEGALPENQIYLGMFNNGVDAVVAAQLRFPVVAASINGCAYCNRVANTDS